MGIGERLRHAIGLKYPVLKDFSDASGVNYRTLQHYLSEQRSVSVDFLTTLSEQIGVSATWILTGVGPVLIKENAQYAPIYLSDTPDFIPIQRFDVSASAGHGSLVGVEEGTGHYAFNRKWIDRRGLKPANLSVISVRGDSMEPALHDQDLILIDRSQKRPRDGDIYVVRYSGDLFVKHVQIMPRDRIELQSTNPLYSPIIIDVSQDDASENADLAFIGRVVASMHEW